MVADTYNPSPQETEARQLLKRQGQPGWHSKFQDGIV